ncbi:autotransporter outer membrane beta-barrel domain-containing protein [Paenibacillus vandeheii]
MRNTSETIKENSHVMNAQGGEKKVMKKILSVALSTAMAFSMFASVAFGDTAVSPQQQFDALKAKGVFTGYPDGTAGLDKEMTRAEFAKVITKLLGLKEITGVYSYNDKNYNAKNWAAPYIEAVTAAGIMEGKNVEKKIFDFNGKVTIEEMAKVLTIALDLEVPTETNNSATAWAKGYVQAAINAGLLDSSLNFQSNASRQLLVGAAYAIDQEQSLKVASYEVTEAGKVVTFKMSDGESVKVTLDTALAANKETEVKFTYKDKSFTEKVTYVTTVAQTVQSVKAGNLKQIVVTFDGTVDATTATEVSNYTIANKTIDSATLSDDKTSVTLLLADGSALNSQRATDLKIANVKNGDATKTFSQTVSFTPADVTVPTVESVTALGTKAIKIKFSEPVDKSQAAVSSNYRVDGNVVAASVSYSYPDTVILTTNLTEGEHTLTVSKVQDFSGLTIVPVDNKFTATVDTAAPEITSVTSSDLKKVVVTFNEPVKNVTSAYANTTSNSASISVSDNKVTLTFANNLNLSENAITLKGVRDYSDNSADRTTTVTPTLDTTRPTVVSTSFAQDTNGNYIATLKFSKDVSKTSAETRSNYVLTDEDGDIASITGINTYGYPTGTIEYNSTNKTVSVNLGKSIGDDKYTLTVSGIQDTSTIANTLLPYALVVNGAEARIGKIDRSWVANGYLYVEYNTNVATSGTGSALEPEKYTINNTAITTYSSDVELVSANTVRISLDNKPASLTVDNGSNLIASYIANADGEYITENGSYQLRSTVGTSAVAATSAYATSRTSVTIEFNAAISFVNPSGFKVDGKTPSNYSLSTDRKTLTLTFSDSNKLAANFSGSITLTDGAAQDTFGNNVAITVPVKDQIKPEIDESTAAFSTTDATYLYVTASEDLQINSDLVTQAAVKRLFTVTVNNTATTAFTVGVDTVNPNRLFIKFDVAPAATDYVSVSFNGSNNAGSKAITDKSADKNALTTFDVSDLVSNLK